MKDWGVIRWRFERLTPKSWTTFQLLLYVFSLEKNVLKLHSGWHCVFCWVELSRVLGLIEYRLFLELIPEQCFSTFLTLRPFTTFPQVVVIPKPKIIFLDTSKLQFFYFYESYCKYMIGRISDMWPKGAWPTGWEPLSQNLKNGKAKIISVHTLGMAAR